MEMVEGNGLGWFIERDSDFLKIEIRGKKEIWRNLKFFEFTSDRKLMSRVLQNTQTG